MSHHSTSTTKTITDNQNQKKNFIVNSCILSISKLPYIRIDFVLFGVTLEPLYVWPHTTNPIHILLCLKIYFISVYIIYKISNGFIHLLIVTCKMKVFSFTKHRINFSIEFDPHKMQQLSNLLYCKYYIHIDMNFHNQ